MNKKKTGSFSLIERVILSAGAMLIFSVSFQIDQMPEGNGYRVRMVYMLLTAGMGSSHWLGWRGERVRHVVSVRGIVCIKGRHRLERLVLNGNVTE